MAVVPPKLKRSLRGAGSYLLQALFPETCLHCSENLVERGLICAACTRSNPEHDHTGQAEGHYPTHFVFEYSGVAKTLFGAAKFSGRRRAAHGLLQEARKDLQTFADGRTVFLPMPSKRKLLRQIMKSSLQPKYVIAKAYRLKPKGAEESNKLLGEAGRFRRIRESLAWSGKVLPDADRYVLCDDVLTTGATLGQAAWLLQQEARVPREKILLWALMHRRREHKAQ